MSEARAIGVPLWRDPRRAGLLMCAFFLLSLIPVPVFEFTVTSGSVPAGPGSREGSWIVSAFLAWRVARGGRLSRMLLILGCAGVCFAAVFVIEQRLAPGPLADLAVYGAELALLLSPAVYLRGNPEGGRVLGWPPLALLPLGAIGGAAVTMLGLLAVSAPGTALAAGAPLRWLTAGRGALAVDWAALARDWVLCSLICATLLYACQARARGRGSIAAAPRRRRPPVAVTGLAIVAALSLAAAVAGAVVIIGRADGYRADTVSLRTGQPAGVVLSPGRYGVFVGCAADPDPARGGCGQLDRRGLSVRDARGVIPIVDDLAYGFRPVRGQPFARELGFTVPAREQVRVVLAAHPGWPVFVAPAKDEGTVLRGWRLSAAGAMAVLAAALAGLAWMLGRRERARPASQSPGHSSHRGRAGSKDGPGAITPGAVFTTGCYGPSGAAARGSSRGAQ